MAVIESRPLRLRMKPFALKISKKVPKRFEETACFVHAQKSYEEELEARSW